MDSTPASFSPDLSRSAPQPGRPKSGWIRPVFYLLLVGLASYTVWRVYTNQQNARIQTANQANALLNRPVPVQAAPVEQRSMPIYLTALGTVTPYYSVTVKARVNGQLDKVNFTEGELVKAGQTIAIIDPKPYKAALDQAKGTLAHDLAALKNAQAEYIRYKALYEAGVVSKEQLDLDQSNQGQFEGQIEADKAAIETAQLQLDWCTIQSPITGKIGLRLVDPGNIITANTTNLVIVNQFEPIAVYFTLPENLLPQVLGKLRGEQRISAEAFDRGDTSKIATGQLLTADNQIDTTTGTDKLKAVFANQDERLFPNQFVNIHLILEQRSKALVVPSAAIQSGAQGSFVWTVQRDNTVKMQLVKIALAEGQVTILDSGPNSGDKVVVDGADRLRQDAKVIVSAPRQLGNPTAPSPVPNATSGLATGSAPAKGNHP
jgi:multidrug efflux system membrane fusion protein